MDPLEEVYARADTTEHRGLTVEKIWDRGTVLEVTEEAIVFDVERHHSASGALYREGLAMSAFVTFWPRYRFDRSSHELTELEERRPREFECNYDRLVDEMLDYPLELRVRRREGQWLCEERVMNLEAEVDDVEDVQDFAEWIVREWDLKDFHGPDLEDVLEPDELDAHFSRLEDELAVEARRQAREAWERRDENSS